MNFVDRTDELGTVRAFLEDPDDSAARIQLFRASPKSGASSFFRHCSARMAHDSDIGIYVDGANGVANSIFSQFVVSIFNRHKQHWKSFEKHLAKRLGHTRTREVSLAATACIPWVGAGVSKVAEGMMAPPFSVSAYPSAVAELLCEFLVKLSKNVRVRLFIDNVQEIDSWSRDLLTSTISQSYSGLRYLGAFIERPSTEESFDSFRLAMSDLGYRVQPALFPPPGSEFVLSYAAAIGLRLSPREAKALAVASNGDIYRIRAALSQLIVEDDGTVEHIAKLSSPQRYVVTVLAICRQALRLTDVTALAISDETTFVNSEMSLHEEIEALVGHDVVSIDDLPDGDKLIFLKASPEVAVQLLELTQAEEIRVGSFVYDYYRRAGEISARHSRAELGPLMYRLAKRIHPEEAGARLQDLLAISLQMGSRTVAEEFMDRALDTTDERPLDLHRFAAKLAFLVSVKRYGRLKEMVDNIPNSEWQRIRFFRVLYGIALNRLRLHEESERILAELTKTATLPDELALLVSYRIVGYIHANKVAEARQLFGAYENRVKSAGNYGYFLRNGAEVFRDLRALDILDQAAGIHKRLGDSFGLATTLSNLGAKKAQVGSASEGRADTSRARDMLEVFGIHHLGIATANVGHCHLYLRQFDEAAVWFRRALKLFGPGLPRSYTQMNLAVAHLFMGGADVAQSLIREVCDTADLAKVDRVRQKAYYNGALILLSCAAPTTKVNELCDRAERYPDRWSPSSTRKLTDGIRRMAAEGSRPSAEEFFRLYSPCSLLYWYQNPLASLPSDLTPQTSLEDFKN